MVTPVSSGVRGKGGTVGRLRCFGAAPVMHGNRCPFAIQQPLRTAVHQYAISLLFSIHNIIVHKPTGLATIPDFPWFPFRPLFAAACL